MFYAVRKGAAPVWQLAIAGFFALLPIVTGGRYTHSRAKSHALSFLRGRTQQDMDDLARSFFRDRIMKRLYPLGAAELNRLRAEGYRILFVSASPDVYMRVLPEFLPADAVIATPCGLDNDNRYTGLVGENCKGIDKPLRIAEYLAANHLELDWEHSRAYGDSPSDAPMLALVATPICVNPAKSLRDQLPTATIVTWKRGALHPNVAPR